MTIEYIDRVADPAQHAANPVVTTTGLQITMQGMQFRVSGVDYEIVGAQDYVVVPDPTYDMSVIGYLVKDGAGGPHLLVDANTSLDPSNAYTFNDGVYESLWLAFDVMVPAGTTTLNGLTVRVRRHVTEA